MTKAAADRTRKTLKEDKAAQQMCDYYKAKKPFLISKIRVHRGSIFSNLMQGESQADAFAPFVRSSKYAARVSVPFEG